MKTILVTGCAGYIGTHTSVVLLEAGYNVIGIDDFSNSKPKALDGVREITGKTIKFYEGNMRNEALLDRIFDENEIDAVIDFAAYKSVGDSVNIPIEYYENNVSSVLTLLKVMRSHDVKSLIFSSSATVYGDAEKMPVNEESPIGGTTNPYGTSKLFVEMILSDLYKSDNSWNICIFRYFNPVGAHPSGKIGEDPEGEPANLVPYITKVATGELGCLSIFGNDYDTKDGTGVRDFIHIMDLAEAHKSGIEMMEKNGSGLFIYNLGTGYGHSVLEMVNTFEDVNGVDIKYKFADRRPGDIAVCYADVAKVNRELGWKSTRGIKEMCKDAYNFQKRQNND